MIPSSFFIELLFAVRPAVCAKLFLFVASCPRNGGNEAKTPIFSALLIGTGSAQVGGRSAHILSSFLQKEGLTTGRPSVAKIIHNVVAQLWAFNLVEFGTTLP